MILPPPVPKIACVAAACALRCEANEAVSELAAVSSICRQRWSAVALSNSWAEKSNISAASASSVIG